MVKSLVLGGRFFLRRQNLRQPLRGRQTSHNSGPLGDFPKNMVFLSSHIQNIYMSFADDELKFFEKKGTPDLDSRLSTGTIVNENARIWYAHGGVGPPVILLHGGLGHSGNWSYQVRFLLENGFHVIVIDCRGHGRSTRDVHPFSYELMGSDVIGVMDELNLVSANLVGWSNGACIFLILAHLYPYRVQKVFFFGCNMDPSGLQDISFPHSILDRCFSRHRTDYINLSSTPNQFDRFVEDLNKMMNTEPNYTAAQLLEIETPVTVVHSENDEFIKMVHAEYLVKTLPNSKYVFLRDVSHFAPLQRPDMFNEVLLSFLNGY